MELNKVDNHKKQLIEALEKYRGIVSTACKSVGLSRTTYYDYVNGDPDFAKAVEEAQEDAIDFVEGKLFEKINGITMLGKGGSGDDDDEDPTYTLPPSDTAIIFYLKTKGKKRGYVEKMEVENSGSMSINISKEQVKEISKALDEKY